jgi:hypothetical protein
MLKKGLSLALGMLSSAALGLWLFGERGRILRPSTLQS